MVVSAPAAAPQVVNTAEEDDQEASPLKRKKVSKKVKSKRSSKRLKGEEED